MSARVQTAIALERRLHSRRMIHAAISPEAYDRMYALAIEHCMEPREVIESLLMGRIACDSTRSDYPCGFSTEEERYFDEMRAAASQQPKESP